MNELRIQAIEFVNNLVPGAFDQAQAKLSANCEYRFSGRTLSGPSIIQAFEDSHEGALKKVDRIEYLPASFDAMDGSAIVVKVQDRIWLGDREHVYSDRLAITLEHIKGGWFVSHIEHRPYEEERAKLKEFLTKSV